MNYLWQTNFEDRDSKFCRQPEFSLPSNETNDEDQKLRILNQNVEQPIFDGENEGIEGFITSASSPQHDVQQTTSRCIDILLELQNLLSLADHVNKFTQTKDDVIPAESDVVENVNVVQTERICETLFMDDESCQLHNTENTLHGPDIRSGPDNLTKCSEYTSMRKNNQNEVCKEVMEQFNEDLYEIGCSRSEELTENGQDDSQSEIIHDEVGMDMSAAVKSGIDSGKDSKRRIETSDCNEDKKTETTKQAAADRDDNKESKSKSAHLKTELECPVSLNSLLFTSTKKWLSNISIDGIPQTKLIQEMASHLMNDTVVVLQEKHQIFSKCYIIKTGSMAEGTKIYNPNEVDFNVALPMLANPDVAELFYIQAGIKVRLRHHFCNEIISFLQQFPFFDSSHRHYLINAYLLQVFRETMKDHIPQGWAMREESDVHMMRVYLKNQTLTVHLQCTHDGPYPGFILSIDVCFGIPLDAERLDGIYVPDMYHATNISFIQSECLRLKTGVIAVINRNPFVAQRFFFETETQRFHGNKPVGNCYKLAKHVARTFLPKIVKNNCILCEDSLIPSIYIKTVVLFMMDIYTESSYWCDTELVNRLVEIFEVLSYSFAQGEFRTLSYYSYIYSMYLDCWQRYIPDIHSIKDGVGMDRVKPCTIPSIEDVNLSSSPVGVTSALQSYWTFMECEEWTVGKLLGKLTELLYFLKFTENTFI